MHLPHFYMSDLSGSEELVTLRDENHHHLRNVLRLRLGDPVILAAKGGIRVRCEVREVRKDATALAVLEQWQEASPPLTLHLGLALLQPQKLDLTVQKAAEWGVALMTPLQTRHSRSLAGQKTSRWQKIAVEALCQAEAPVLLEVRDPEPLAAWLARCDSAARFVFDEEGGVPLKDLLATRPTPRTAAMLLGPEGGWERAEVESALAAGFTRTTLGRRNFRSETAAFSAMALVMHHWGIDFVRR